MALDVRALLASKATNSARPSILVDREDDLRYDLGHLSVVDPTPTDTEALSGPDRAGYLQRVTRENTQLLTNKLFELLADSKSKSTIRLPPPETTLPREKPLPEPKPLTRWDRFAADKGIVKKKRSKMVWDEDQQQWAPRWGFGRANNPKDKVQDWLIEAKPGDDGSVDPFEEKANVRKERLNKQKRQEERNRLEAAHASRLGGSKAPAGAALGNREDKKKYLRQAIEAAQLSTASVGKFDRALPNEPSKTKGKRKHYESATSADDTKLDETRTAKVYERMFNEHKRVNSVNSEQLAKQARLSEEARNSKAKASKAGVSKKSGKSKAGKPALKAGGAKKGGKGKSKGGAQGKRK